MVSSAAKRARKKKLAHERQDRESLRLTRQMDPAELTDPEMEREDDEVRFAPRGQSVEQMPATPRTAQAATGCMEEDIVNMIKTLNGAIAAISRDTVSIQKAYMQLRAENVARDKTLADLAEIVKEYGLTSTTRRPQPVLREDVIDGDGNLRAADIGITFLHGVRVVGPGPSRRPGMRPAMSTPQQPMGGRHRDDSPSTAHQQTQPVMSTPYRPTLGQDRDLGPSSVRPVTPEVDYQTRRPPTETRQGYRPAAPIQRFNNKSLNWPAWFRHFRAVADVHGWNKDQRALQLVSYLDETAMNVAQELGDADLYNYDVLVKLLSDRFDPASRVSASRSRFHGRSRCHHEDADTFADALAELCRVGYPQSPAELRQELIAEQFVRGQSDPELKKYLWVVIRTQKDRKLQTLIEVCTDFASLSTPSHLHRPAEQTFAVHQSAETSYMEKKCSQWVIGPHGQTGDYQRRPGHPHYSRCSLWLSEWVMRCDLSAGRPMRRDSSLEVDHLLARTGVSAPNSEPDVTTRSFVVSVVASLVTCRHVVPNRTHHCHTNQLVGFSSLRATDREIKETGRKTHPRSGLHPPWSTRASFDPHSSFSHQIIMGFTITITE